MNNLAQRYDKGAEYAEVIITNYDPKEQAKLKPHHQLQLFATDEDNEN